MDSPLLETTVNGATDIIVNFSGNVGIVEAYDAITYLSEVAGEEANIIFGTVDNDVAGEDVSITIIATGLEDAEKSSVVGGSTVKAAPKPPTFGISTPSTTSMPSMPSLGGAKKATPVPLNLGNDPVPVQETPLQTADTSSMGSNANQNLKIPDFLKRS